MQEVSLSGSLREGVGKKDAKALRNGGLVPSVIYGGEKEYHISVRQIDLEKIIFTPNVYIINIDLDGKKIRVIAQDIQVHPVTDEIVHADFMELRDDKKVKVRVPVRLHGRPIGVINGGKLSQLFRKVRVMALPENLPDAIDIDVSKMKIGDTVRVKDLETGGLAILRGENIAICTVKMVRGAIEDEEEEEGEEGEEGTEGTEEGAEGEGKSEEGGGEDKGEGGDE